MRFAIPVTNGVLDPYFGHCGRFAIVETSTTGDCTGTRVVVPPPHEPGVLPRWLAEQGVDVVIAGGMGPRALALFEAAGTRVVTGAPGETPEALVDAWRGGNLLAGENACDHDRGGTHHCQ